MQEGGKKTGLYLQTIQKMSFDGFWRFVRHSLIEAEK